MLCENGAEVLPSSMKLSLSNAEGSEPRSFNIDPHLDDEASLERVNDWDPVAGQCRPLGACRVQQFKSLSRFFGDLELHGEVLPCVGTACERGQG